MHTIFRSALRFTVPVTVIFAGAGGCSSIDTPSGTPSPYTEGAVTIIPPASPSRPSPSGLDEYKTQVAEHVARHDPARHFSGKLPPMLPAIVVLKITVDRDGQLAGVEVQRSRDPEASEVALAAMRRSAPLPPPHQLASASGRLTFLETFLFADQDRYQLRSLADPQTAD